MADLQEKPKEDALEEKAQVKKTIDDLVYTETYDKAVNEDYNTEEYKTFLENMKGGNEQHHGGNFHGTK